MDFDIKNKIDERKFDSISQDISKISSSGRGQILRKMPDPSDFGNEEENGNEPEGTRFVGTDTNDAADDTGIIHSLNNKNVNEENFPGFPGPGEIPESVPDQAKSSALLKMKKQIIQQRLWLEINPVEKSNEFAGMLRNMDLFYKNIKKRKPLKKSGSERGVVLPERFAAPGKKLLNTLLPISGTMPGGANLSNASAPLIPGVNKEPTSSHGLFDQNSEKPLVGKKLDSASEKPPEKTDKADSAQKEPDVTPKEPDAASKDADASKKEDEHRKALNDTARDTRREEADRLRREKETNRDREEKQKMEKVAGLTHEIKEINSGISRLESQINDLEGNLKEMESENRDNPDFDPEPYRDEIEDKKIQIEMMQMKKELKMREIESLMGKPVESDSYDENAVDTTMAKSEIHRQRFDEAEYKSKETLKHNLEFLEEYKGDKKGADVVSRFSANGKETGATQKSSELQTLIESKFDVKLDPVEMKNK